MGDVMDHQRATQLTRELGDDFLAERLIAARCEVVQTVPDLVARRHLAVILAEDHLIGGPTDADLWPATSPVTPAMTRTARPADRARDPGRIGSTLAGSLRRLTSVAAATTLVIATGLAASGLLPAAAQEFVAEAVALVGWELPRSATDAPDGATDHPAARHRAVSRHAGESPPRHHRPDDAPGLGRGEAVATGVPDGLPTPADAVDAAAHEPGRRADRPDDVPGPPRGEPYDAGPSRTPPNPTPPSPTTSKPTNPAPTPSTPEPQLRIETPPAAADPGSSDAGAPARPSPTGRQADVGIRPGATPGDRAKTAPDGRSQPSPDGSAKPPPGDRAGTGAAGSPTLPPHGEPASPAIDGEPAS